MRRERLPWNGPPQPPEPGEIRVMVDMRTPTALESLTLKLPQLPLWQREKQPHSCSGLQQAELSTCSAGRSVPGQQAGGGYSTVSSCPT